MIKKKKVLLLSNDFGGGFNLFLFAKNKLKGVSKDYYFKGPSLKILKNHKKINLSKLNFENYSSIYYSLSWNKKIENLILKNKKYFKFSTYLVLDGWGDYKKKIFFKNKNFIPDNIICLDRYSFYLSRKQNLNLICNLKFYPNILFNEFRKNKKPRKLRKKKILYLTSPLIKKNKIKMIQNYISKNFKGSLEVKYHPKLSSAVDGQLSKILGKFDYVFGHYSTALIYSSMMGIKTFSLNHTNLDIFKWKKLKVFSNFKISIINNKNFNFAFKKIRNEYI